MTIPVRETVRQLFDRLGDSLLTLVAGSPAEERLVGDVVIQAGDEPLAADRDAIVLGVGAPAESAALCGLLREIGAVSGSALILRAPVPADEAVALAAAESRVPLFSLVEGTPWMYLADMIRPVHGWREEDSFVTEASLSADLNLFKVANSLSEILDTPVTIEDLRSRVMAFSADQERGDDARKASVLGQQVPRHLGAEMVRLGVFQRLYSSSRPVYVEPLPSGVRARVAMQIRSGSALLGSIWAIAGDEPLSEAQEEAMIQAAHTAAGAILQGRVAADAVQRLRTATVAALIGGGQPARAAAGKVHRERVRGGCVVAARLRESGRAGGRAGAEVDAVAAERLASSLVMYLRAECATAVAAIFNDTIYAVMLHTTDFCADVRSVQRLIRSFVERRGACLDGLSVGIGNAVSDPADLGRSREDAELVLRVLDMPRNSREPGAQVATREGVHGLSLVLRLSDIAAGDPVCAGGPLARLEAYDLEHQSNLVETLDCWLAQFGDVTSAAERLHVHKNTLRYRLRRIEEVGGVTLEDPEQRFELMLEFRVRQSLGSSGSPELQIRRSDAQASPVQFAAQFEPGLR
ncbi:MAG TPA: helix-turn-helix domain-containing protein [Solirubrobacteraceae bacterium]|nr:helix-turn-helix domain-containing protein [Solirubrobacteraceae bacterium]